jgi:hypothetical protein
VSKPKDKEIAWQGRIQDRAAAATKAIWDRVASMPKSGFASLTPAERRDIQETIAKQIVDTMKSLGDTVVAGAQDFQVATLEGVSISKGKVKMALIPAADSKINLELLAANAGKQVVVAFINGVAYEQARDALSKVIHREQTDWINRDPPQDADENALPENTIHVDGNVIEGTATAVVANISARAEGDLIADQPPGETDEASEENPEQEAGEGQPEDHEGDGGTSGSAGASGATGDVGPWSEGADSGDSVPPPATPAKRRRGGRPWAGHH